MPESHPSSAKTRQLPVLLAAFFLFAYLASASRHVLGGDCAEFALIYAEGGVPHPSGYPLYVAWLRSTGWIPVSSPAWGASLATSILGATGAWLLYAAGRAWGASRSGAATAASLFAFAPLMWTQSTQPEVFALHVLLANGIVAVAGPRHGLRTSTRAFLVGLLAGAGLSNNHSLVLLAPLGLFAAWETVRTSTARARTVGLGLAGLALGLSPHLLLPFWATAEPDRWQWGDPSSFAGFWHHVLRRDFGTFSLGIYDGDGLVLEQQKALVLTVLRNTMGVGAFVAFVGHLLLARDRIRASRHEAARWTCLAVSAALMGPVFVGLFNLEPVGLAAAVVERFHLVPLALVCLGVGFAVDALRRRLRISRELVVIPVVAAIALGVLFGLPRVRDGHRPTLELYARNVLQSLPERAVLLGTGDHRLFAFQWMRRVEQLRTDVVYIDGAMLLHPWYAERIERELGFPLVGVQRDARVVSTSAVIRGLQAQGRSVFVTNRYSPAIAREHRLVPWGAVHRLLDPSEDGIELNAVAVANRTLLGAYEIESRPPAATDPWGAAIYADYMRPWLELAYAYESVGHAEMAATFRAYADELNPGRTPSGR